MGADDERPHEPATHIPGSDEWFPIDPLTGRWEFLDQSGRPIAEPAIGDRHPDDLSRAWNGSTYVSQPPPLSWWQRVKRALR